MVGLTHNERCLIYNLRIEKHWGLTRITRMFPNKLWSRRNIDYLIRKIDTDITWPWKVKSWSQYL